MSEYTIIWIDDEYETRGTFIDECGINGLVVKPFSNAEDGLKYFGSNHPEIDGFILDAKMFEHAESETTDLTGLTLCRDQISRLEVEYKKSIPYLIYTGQPGLLDDENFEQMVGTDKIFSKNDDNDALFAELKKRILDTPEATLKQQYRTLYNCCFNGPMQPEIWTTLTPYLMDLSENKVLSQTAYNEVRKVMEAIFHSLVNKKLLPLEFGSDIRLTEVSKFLSGIPDPTGKALSSPLPKAVTNQIRFILDVSQTGSHAESAHDGVLRLRVAELTSRIGPECRLANTLVLMTADVASWFAGLLSEEEASYSMVQFKGAADLEEEGEVTGGGRYPWALNNGRDRKSQPTIPDELVREHDLNYRDWCTVTTELHGDSRVVKHISNIIRSRTKRS